MKNAGHLKSVSIAAAIALLIALAVWLVTGTLNACSDSSVVRNMKMNEANGCLEFWFYRYQTLVAGILALISATVTVRVMYWQSLAVARSNERVARVYAFGCLRTYLSKATATLDAQMIASPAIVDVPSLDLGEGFNLVGYLPNELARLVFQFRKQTEGIKANVNFLLGIDVPNIDAYIVAALSRKLIDAEELAQRIGNPLDLSGQEFTEGTAKQLQNMAKPYDDAMDLNDVIVWLRNLREED